MYVAVLEKQSTQEKLLVVAICGGCQPKYGFLRNASDVYGLTTTSLTDGSANNDDDDDDVAIFTSKKKIFRTDRAAIIPRRK